MIAKSLIAAAAIAASAAAFAPAQQAQAGTDIDITVGFGGRYPGYGYGHYPYRGYRHYPVYNRYHNAISCHRGKNIVDRSGFNNVRAVDCSLPSYKYTGRKWGHKYLVSVNGRGNITVVRRIY